MSPTTRTRRTSPNPRTAELANTAEYPLPAVDTSRPPWPGEYVTVNGIDVFVRRTPSTAADPQPALYVHGLGGASTNFTDLAGLLSPYFAGEALDLAGFGHSGAAGPSGYSIAAHADLVARYLDQTGRGPVHLVGNSMGGAISIRLAATRPELVRTLTLVSPAVPDLRVHKPADLVLPSLLLPGVGRRALRRMDLRSPRQRARALINLCFAHPELVPDNRIEEAAQDVLARSELPWAHDAMLASLRGIAAMYLTPGRNSSWRLMRGIGAPTVVVWGQHDRLVHVSNAARVADAIPDASLLVLPEAGHVAQLEEPVVTARAILALAGRANDRRNPAGVGA